jgi:hypothetical protein
MKRRRVVTGLALAVSAATMVAFGAPALVRAADHLDAPAVNGQLQSPSGRHDADIADTYVFRSPEHGDRTVLAVTTHPLLGSTTTDPTYGTDISYNIHLDRVGLRQRDGREARHSKGDDNDEAREARHTKRDDNDDDERDSVRGQEKVRSNRTLQVKFDRASGDGSQEYTVYLVRGDDRDVLATGRTNRLNSDRDDRVRTFAGKVSDPFFFDLGAFNNTVQNRLTMHILPLNKQGSPAVCTANQGVDTFAAANTNGIVIEVPNELLGGKVNVWASTVRSDGTRIDRESRPAINTVFNGKKVLLAEGDDADKNIFNRIKNPRLDPITHTSADTGPTFHDNVVTVLNAFDHVAQAVGGFTPRSPATINGLANTLLPDVLPYSPAVAKTDGITNGRSLADDVIDNELPIVTNGLVSTDCVGPHHDYRSTFPYLGAPH